MKILSESSIPKLILITPLLIIVILTVIFIKFFMVKMDSYFEKEQTRFVKEFISNEEKASKQWLEQINALFLYSNNRLERTIKRDLKNRVDLAKKTAHYIYEKYDGKIPASKIKLQIKDALTNMVWQGKKNYIWITDYDGNNLLAANEKFHEINMLDYVDTQGRAIILEEIQKVRRHQEGYIKTFFSSIDDEQILFVKDLGIYDWFIGSSIHINDARDTLKNAMFRLMMSIPSDASGFLVMYDKNGLIYLSDEAKKHLSQDEVVHLKQEFIENPEAILSTKHARMQGIFFEPFGWYLFYGFDHEQLNHIIKQQSKGLSKDIEDEFTLIVATSIVFALLVGILSILASRRINKIFLQYREEVKHREERLEEWARTLEERVKVEVHAHQEKEKMLIQQSKMAAMGDMISMIAHQWRQPLNQMSYVFMNIEGAYEYKELTQEYLESKIKEGTELLEYMSHTIDDFRNFFRPDKEREILSVNEVVDETMPLMAKSLEAHGITYIIDHESETKISLYRNELMQVLLNILKNAKDVLIEKKISNAIIEVATYESDAEVFVRVCDNGGGIDAAIMEKIFDPYFSTKDSNSGTGLGLYMSKTIVEEHLQGKLSCENTEMGVCFSIVIPKTRNIH